MFQLRNMFVVILLRVFVFSRLACASNYKTDMEILVFIPDNDKHCRESMSIAVEAAQNNENMLVGFNLVVNFINEGFNAQSTPEQLIRHLRNCSDNLFVTSPIVVGPSQSCQFASGAAPYFGITQFSSFCAGPNLTVRHKLPNLYRVQMPGEFALIAMIQFVKQVGNWKEIGIVTYSKNVNEYSMAQQLNRMAMENGIDIVHYFSESYISKQMVDEMRNSRARVIAMIYLGPKMCMKFLCEMFKHEATGSHYVFIGYATCIFDPYVDDLPNGCSSEDMEKQLRQTFFAGASQIAMENNGPSEFGYDLVEFERLLMAKLSLESPSRNLRRHTCHDSMMAALIALNNSETVLKRESSTLKDFCRNHNFVGKIVNETASKINFQSLRIGHIKYGPKSEIFQEKMSILQRQEGTFRLVYSMDWNATITMEAHRYNRTMLEPVLPVVWQNLKPPKDLSNVEIIEIKLSNLKATILLVISAIFLFKDLTFIVVFKHFYKKQQRKPVFDLMTTIGGISINVTSALIVVYNWNSQDGIGICKAYIIGTIVGLTLIITSLVSRCFLHFLRLNKLPQTKIWHSTKFSLSSTNFSSSSTKFNSFISTRQRMHRMEMEIEIKSSLKIEQNTRVITFVSVLVNFILIMIWFLGPWRGIYNHQLRGPTYFDVETHQYAAILSSSCQSDHFTTWVFIFCFYQLVWMLIGLLLALRISKMAANQLIFEIKQLRIFLIGVPTIFVASLLILLLVSQSQSSSIVAFDILLLVFGNLITTSRLVLVLVLGRQQVAEFSRQSTHWNAFNL